MIAVIITHDVTQEYIQEKKELVYTNLQSKTLF